MHAILAERTAAVEEQNGARKGEHSPDLRNKRHATKRSSSARRGFHLVRRARVVAVRDRRARIQEMKAFDREFTHHLMPIVIE